MGDSTGLVLYDVIKDVDGDYILSVSESQVLPELCEYMIKEVKDCWLFYNKKDLELEYSLGPAGVAGFYLA